MGKFKSFVEKAAPVVLTTLSIAGAIATPILVAKQTPKALKAMEDAQYEKHDI